jgi:hypothetical protein
MEGSQPSLLLINVLSLLRPRTPFGVELGVALDLDPDDFLDEIHEPVDDHHLGAADVDGIDDVASISAHVP